jgi:hypothetical protein
LQATIAHHGIVLNNPDPEFTSINFFPQWFIVVIANIPPTIDALACVDPVGEFFRILKVKFPIKSFEKKL